MWFKGALLDSLFEVTLQPQTDMAGKSSCSFPWGVINSKLILLDDSLFCISDASNAATTDGWGESDAQWQDLAGTYNEYDSKSSRLLCVFDRFSLPGLILCITRQIIKYTEHLVDIIISQSPEFFGTWIDDET